MKFLFVIDPIKNINPLKDSSAALMQASARKKEARNPFQQPTKIYPKVVRGGSWMDSPKRLRSASRRPSSKKWKMRDPQIPKSKWWHTDAPFVGFRIVRPVKTPVEEEQKKYWNYNSD